MLFINKISYLKRTLKNVLKKIFILCIYYVSFFLNFIYLLFLNYSFKLEIIKKKNNIMKKGK